MINIQKTNRIHKMEIYLLSLVIIETFVDLVNRCGLQKQLDIFSMKCSCHVGGHQGTYSCLSIELGPSYLIYGSQIVI